MSRLRGTAANDHTGATLVLSDGETIDVETIERWPDEVVGEAALVVGTLELHPPWPGFECGKPIISPPAFRYVLR